LNRGCLKQGCLKQGYRNASRPSPDHDPILARTRKY
jgi:hypothetical protein